VEVRVFFTAPIIHWQKSFLIADFNFSGCRIIHCYQDINWDAGHANQCIINVTEGMLLPLADDALNYLISLSLSLFQRQGFWLKIIIIFNNL
jgi:hypothetical protein